MLNIQENKGVLNSLFSCIYNSGKPERPPNETNETDESNETT